MLGTILSVTNLALTAGIIVVLLVYRKRLFNIPADTITPRQYERMTARMDQFELAEIGRAKLEQDFRHNVIEASQSQLCSMEKHNGLLEGLNRKIDYVSRVLAELPCRRDNGKECPEGHGE